MKCELCDFETDDYAKFGGHRSGHVRRKEVQKRNPRKDYTCKKCGKRFESGHQVGSHTRNCVTSDEWLLKLTDGKQRKNLKSILLLLGRKHECETCGLSPVWNNQPLTLQVDHIDGNHANNSLENLRFLCPNCHTQTSTYGRKKRIGK